VETEHSALQAQAHHSSWVSLTGPVEQCRFCLTLLMGDTSKLSTLMRGLYTFCFAKPGSITYTMPSMVSDVSAMFVDTTILRPSGPPGMDGGGACSNHIITAATQPGQSAT
jgi:hypothetical protein